MVIGVYHRGVVSRSSAGDGVALDRNRAWGPAAIVLYAVGGVIDARTTALNHLVLL